MAQRPEGKGGSQTGDSLSTVDAIRVIAAANARSDLNSEKQLRLFLESWWSRTYNRPLKDPLLSQYSIEELIYEFYDKVERKLAEEERLNQETDKIEEDKDKEVLDWAEEEEKRELEEMKAKAAKTSNPTTDPANVKWMEEQMAEAKKHLGEDFGEDISLDFE